MFIFVPIKTVQHYEFEQAIHSPFPEGNFQIQETIFQVGRCLRGFRRFSSEKLAT